MPTNYIYKWISVLPVFIAIAYASGLTPQSGIYSAIIGSFILSLGTKKLCINGPAVVLVLLISELIANYGTTGLVMATALAGITILILRYIGFANIFIQRKLKGIVIVFDVVGVLAVLPVLKDLLGISVSAFPSSMRTETILYDGFIKYIWQVISLINMSNVNAILISLSTLLIIFISSKYMKNASGYFVAVLCIPIITNIFDIKVDTIGSRFSTLGSYNLYNDFVFDYSKIKYILAYAFVIALIITIESLLTDSDAKNIDFNVNPYTTLLANQGTSNLITSLISGLPVTYSTDQIKTSGSLPEYPIKIRVICMLTLSCISILMFFYIKYLPLCVLASILAYYVVWKLFFDLKEIVDWKSIYNSDDKIESNNFVIALGIVGVLIAACLMLFVMSIGPYIINTVTFLIIIFTYLASKSVAEKIVYYSTYDDYVSKNTYIPNYITLLNIDSSSLFNCNINTFVDFIKHDELKSIVLLRIARLASIGSSGLRALEVLHDRLNSLNSALIVCGASSRTLNSIVASKVGHKIGRDNIYSDTRSALVRAKNIYRSRYNSDNGPDLNIDFATVKQATEYELVRYLSHNLKPKINISCEPIRDVKNYLIENNFNKELLDGTNETLEEALDLSIRTIQEFLQALENVQRVVNNNIPLSDFELHDVYAILHDMILPKWKNKIYNLVVEGSPSFAYIHKSSFIDAIDNIIRNAEIHGFNGANIENPQVLFLVSNNDTFVFIDCINNGIPLPSDITESDYLSYGKKSDQSPGQGLGGAWVHKTVDAHSGKFSIIRDNYPFHIRITIPKEV